MYHHRNTRATTFPISPLEIQFHVEDEKTHSQKVRTFNPLEIPVKYNVYTPVMDTFVIEPQGLLMITPRSCGHFFIRLENPKTTEADSKSLFLFTVSDIHTEGVIARNTLLKRFWLQMKM
ncbi:uncharacterized protein LOC135142141 [Zophobas morio]|uniref:uncharacterized protein LOC135142141 n=1 Tax=Zophobas morio TaxID=2755281 RepID=UPI0030838EAE